MNNKECLQRLFDDYEYLIEEYYPRSELIESQLNKIKNNVNKIIQDLDRLEKLEKVIEILKSYHLKTEYVEGYYKRPIIRLGYQCDEGCVGITMKEYEIVKEIL